MYRAANDQFAKHIGAAGGIFDALQIAIELPRGQEVRPDALAAFALAANLLARMFSNLSLVAPDVGLGPNPWRLRHLSELAPALAGVSEGTVSWGRAAEPDIVLGVGAVAGTYAARSCYVTFDGWTAGLDLELAGTRSGPFGALFATCYGAAQVFLYAAAAGGGRHQPIKPFRMSLLTFDETDAYVALPRSVDFGESHLVGVGAVGSAFVYALSHLRGCRGRLHLIDNDLVDETNLQRYVLMRKEDVTRHKPDVAAEALRQTGIDPVAHPLSFKEYQSRHGYDVDLLITPVDSEAGRRGLARCLPRAVLNAATGGTTVTVSRHGFADGKACLHCLYLPQVEEVTTEMRLALDLGLSVEEVADHLLDNKEVSADLVRRVEQHLRKAPGTYAEWAGKHIQTFYQRAVCGEAHISTAAGTVFSPLSFISGAAGVLLASEFVKRANPELAPYALDNYFRVDTLFAPNADFRQVKLQDPCKRCICWDEDFVQVHRRKCGGPPSAEP